MSYNEIGLVMCSKNRNHSKFDSKHNGRVYMVIQRGKNIHSNLLQLLHVYSNCELEIIIFMISKCENLLRALELPTIWPNITHRFA